MALEFKLPDLGEGVAEGEIVKWLISEGQAIKEDEPMVEVMTDKATVQIPSPTSGTVKQILAKEGQTVKVGTNLVILENAVAGKKEGEAADSTAPKPSAEGTREVARTQAPQQQQQQQQQAKPAAPTQRVIATPATRKLARDLGVNIEEIQGSGPAGRVTEEDVKRSPKMGQIRQQTVERLQPAEKVADQRKPEPVLARPTMTAAEQPTAAGDKAEERVPIHGIRKRISEKMFRSAKGTAPVTHVDEVDFTELIALREVTKPLAEAQKVKLTYLPFIIKAVVATLEQFPYFNASIDDEKQEFAVKHYYNIGVATDTPNGLIVPVVKDAKRKDILEIAKEIGRLSDDARGGRIQLQDLQGGTFTITNIGTLGGVISTPIINVPEVAILAIHKIEKKPVVRNDSVAIRQVAYVALTFDHRIVDGADAARFTTALKRYLENPSLIFVEASLATHKE